MAEHGVAALSHVPSGERVRTGPADPSGAWDQDLPPSTATTTQESGLRENRTSRLSERTEEGRKPDLLRLYSDEEGRHCRSAAGPAGAPVVSQEPPRELLRFGRLCPAVPHPQSQPHRPP